MDNPDHKDKTVDDTPTIQTDAPDTEESLPPEHIGAPEDIETPRSGESGELSEGLAEEVREPSEDLDRESGEPSEDQAEEVGEPSEDLDRESGEPSEDQAEEVGEPSEDLDRESGEPSEEPDREPSPDEVRTALVAIRGQNRSAHFNAGEHTLKPGDEVVVQTEQGKAIGSVLEPPVLLGCRGCKHLTILRKATPEEIGRDGENRELEKKAFEYCTKTIEEWEIPMRLVQVEFLLDRSKAVFYFTAEKRVDFRELVRTLAREFATRIEMKQIGIRDEARLLGGVGPCGMAFCCSTFLKEFAPISVKMAKEQNVILNPNKISGGCGRLLCCLNYEYDQYKEASRGVPKIGKKINLPEGTGKVRSVDIFSRTVTIDMTDDKPMVIDIDELREKLK
jgi:cell fate regulator YaaT (PSP1 superfamily)